MCGIVGFIGQEQAAPILLDGLAHLEYRGYDSAGVAVISAQGKLQVEKAVGRLKVLSEQIHGGADLEGCIGLGHTRWATHGAPNIINSHPHVSENGKFAVIHNGIIENYVEIKEFLIGQGIRFKSETDTEVVAQLLEFYYNECHDFLEAVGFTGFSNFDIKYDQRDGKYKFFEINCRQGRSNYYVTNSGFNVAKYVVDEYVFNRPFEPEFVTAQDEALWMVVPMGVVDKYVKDPELRAKVHRLDKEGKGADPSFMKGDFVFNRWLRMWHTKLRHFKLFKTYYK